MTGIFSLNAYKGFGTSIDWRLNLNAITFFCSCQEEETEKKRKEDYFIPPKCAYVRKCPLSLGQEREKMPVITSKVRSQIGGDCLSGMETIEVRHRAAPVLLKSDS